MSAERAIFLVDDLISLVQNTNSTQMTQTSKYQNETFYIGVDCGTGSVRAGLVSSDGTLLCNHSLDINIYNPLPDHYEQSSENIWNQTCKVIKHVIDEGNKKYGITPKQIAGIGFDATCSLVILDKNDNPISVSASNTNEKKTDDFVHNIILWMDHRASKETELINNLNKNENKNKYDVFKYVGGQLSIEMEIPKILWLYNNLNKESLTNIAQFMDLADFLTYKATKNNVRSICTLTCKWTFRSHLLKQSNNVNKNSNNGNFLIARDGWNDDFISAIGLSSINNDNYEAFGKYVGNIGESIPNGMCKECSQLTGLLEGTKVSIGMIDAHCGAIGLLGMQDSGVSRRDEQKENNNSNSISNDHESIANKNLIDFLSKVPFNQRIALIGGTSTCHMMPIKDLTVVNGVWGPYYGALLPKLWLLEGGQSATGALIDYILKSMSCYDKIVQNANEKKQTVYQYLNEYLIKKVEQELEQKENGNINIKSNVCYFTKNLHVNPYFHGNRSPLANPNLRGMISGLKLQKADSIEFAALYYLAGLEALCYDSKFILDTIMKEGIDINCVICTGGLSKNSLFVQLHADITQIPLVLPKEEDSVLVGGAVLGMVAASENKISIEQAMIQLNHAKTLIVPTKNEKVQKFHECKYKVFQKMIDDFQSYEKVMSDCIV